MLRNCSISEFLRACKRIPSPLVHHDTKRFIWFLRSNKCLWICRIGNDAAVQINDIELEQKLAKIENITFHHF